MNTYQVSMIVKTDKTGKELLLELRAKINKVVLATIEEADTSDNEGKND